MIKTAAKIKKSQMLSIVLMGTLRLKPSCMLDYLNILSIEVLEKDQATTRYGKRRKWM
jgi:hypothetical protein